MKQTNNALKFLLAQYRAVFKNAMLKGLASSLILASGLAALASPTYAAVEWGTDKEITISDNQTISDATQEAKNLTISAGGTLTLSGSASEDTSTRGLYVSNSLNINGGNLVIKGTDKQLAQVLGNETGSPITSLKMNGGTIDIDRGSLGTGETSISNAVINIQNLTGLGGVTQPDTYVKYANLTTGYTDIDATKSTSITNSKVNIGDRGVLNVMGDLSVSSTAITLSGEKGTLTGNPNAKGLIDAKAIVRTNGETKLLSGSSITVADGKTGGLFNKSFTLDGDSTITVGSGAALYIAGKIVNSDEGVAFKSKGDVVPAVFQVKSGQITNNGTLVLGANNSTIEAGEGEPAESTVTYTPSKLNFDIHAGTLTNNGTLDIGAAVPKDEQGSFAVEDGTVVSVYGGQLINKADATINVYEGSSLDFWGENSLNNQGKIVLHSDNGASALTVAASALASFKTVNTIVPGDQEKFHIADLSSLGKVEKSGEGSGFICLSNLQDDNHPENSSHSIFTTSSSAFKEQFGIDLNVDPQPSATPNFIFALEAGDADTVLQFSDDLNLNETKVKYFKAFTDHDGLASVGTTEELTYTVDSTNGEDLSGIALHAGDLVFKNASGVTPAPTAVTVSGSGNQAPVKFIATEYISTEGGLPLLLQNADLILNNYTNVDANTVGNLKVDVTLSDNSYLSLEDNPWTAENITLSGTSSNRLRVTNSAKDQNYVNGLTAKNITIKNAKSMVIVGRDDSDDNGSYYYGRSYLKADKINMQDGEFSVVQGDLTVNTFNITGGTIDISDQATLTILGDGKTDSVDFNGRNVTVDSSSVYLNKVDDTLGMTFDKDSGFGFSGGYNKFAAQSSNIYVDLSGVIGTNTISIEQGNSILGKLVVSADSNFLHATGLNVDIPVKEDESGNKTVAYEDLTKGGTGSLNLNFDTEETREATLTGVTGSVTGGWNNIQTENGAASVNTNGQLHLYANQSSEAQSNYVQDKSGNVVGISLGTDAELTLNNAGKIGQINGADAILSTGAGSNVVVVDAKGNADNVTIGTFKGAGILTANKFTADKVTLSAESQLKSTELKVNESLNADGAAIATDKAVLKGTANLDNTTLTATQELNAATLNLDKISEINVSGSLTAENITLTGDSFLQANTIKLKSNGELRVGLDADVSNNAGNSSESTGTAPALSAGSARLVADTISLSNGTLFIDPEFSEKTATVFAKTIGSLNSSEMKIDGNIVVGKNSALGLGGDEAAFYENLARYQTNGSLTNDYGAYAYINTYNINLNGKKLIIAAEDVTKLNSYLNGTASGVNTGTAIYLGTDSALQVSAKALTGAGKDNTQVFTGLTANNSITSTDGTLIVPANMSKEQFKSIFGDKVELAANSKIVVTTENGLYTGVISSSDDLHNGITMQLADNARAILSGLSNPTYDYITNVMSEESAHWDNLKDFDAQLDSDAKNATHAAFGTNGVAIIDDSLGYNFLQDAMGSANSQAIEKSARLASFGGAVQALQTANNSTVDAVNGRLGMGNSAAALTVADNAQGAGLWVAPVYRNFSSDSFDGNGLSYGADVDLFGAALGADFTLANGLRVGAAFNVGSGDADGQGTGAGVSNEFDYWGLSLYAGFTPIENLSLSADISFTQTDNDLSLESGIVDYGKLIGSADATAWSVGVNAQYLIKSSLDVAPHIGMRYTNLDIDDYDVKALGEVLAHTNGDSASVFSIPVGVSLSKDIVQGDWTIRPAADLTVTLNFGDDDIQSTTEFNGVFGDNITYNTEFMDNVTYSAAFGLSAKNGNLSFGINAGYIGSSNTDEYTVGANARFAF